MSDVLAITPEQAKARRITAVPTAVIESFNELIVENLDGKHATVRQPEVVTRIKSKLNQPFDNKWLNVEDIYRLAGWRVVYDKPDYTESRDALFEFTAK